MGTVKPLLRIASPPSATAEHAGSLEIRFTVRCCGLTHVGIVFGRDLAVVTTIGSAIGLLLVAVLVAPVLVIVAVSVGQGSEAGGFPPETG